MANVLRVARVEQIFELYRQGKSQRQIARELQIDRGSVSRYLKQAAQGLGTGAAGAGPGESKPAIPHTGSAPPKPAILHIGADSKPATVHTGTGAVAMLSAPLPALWPPGGHSKCEPHRTFIVEGLEAGHSAQRIFQDLKTTRDFKGSYFSVLRMVQRLKHASVLPFRRMECAPGAEAQVDFGSGPMLVGQDGKRRKTHVFRITLSHSRKSYSEAVLRQTTDDFMRCLENAFWAFGGVPKTLVIDNLKAAVEQADWYDPELNPKLHAFCRHYGTVLLPCKPYTPRHKGKIESGIKYVKNNALKGRVFTSLQAQNEHLNTWEERVADRRIHDTTKRQVKEVFETAERSALLPLPTERFPSFQEQQRIVHRDAHVEVAKAYYSVPPEYMGRTVWVRWDGRLVRVFNSRWEEIALHARAEPGRFSTDVRHLAAEKISSVERGADALLCRTRRIGAQTGRWAEAMLKDRGIEGVRVLVGLLALARQYLSADLERACEVAAGHGAYRLRVLRTLLKRQPSSQQEELDFMAEHPLIRRMDDYGALVKVSFREERPWKEPPIVWPTEERPTTTT
jgi:transposase